VSIFGGNSPGGSGGDMYDSGMGPHGDGGILGGSIEFKPGGRIHHSVFGAADGGRVSWDTTPGGSPFSVHFTDQGYAKGEPDRHPFGNG
jgi:hypothetical protein